MIRFAVLSTNNQTIDYVGDCEEETISLQGGSQTSLECPPDVEPDTHYYYNNQFVLYPAKPHEHATWNTSTRTWTTPNAATLESFFDGAEYSVSDVTFTLNTTAKTIAVSAGRATRIKGIYVESKTFSASTQNYSDAKLPAFIFYNWNTNNLEVFYEPSSIMSEPRWVLIAEFDGTTLKNIVENPIIDGTKLLSRSVKTSHVIPGAINSTLLSQNAVVASKVSGIDTYNIVLDPDLQDAEYWVLGQAATSSLNVNYGTGNAWANSRGAWIVDGATGNTALGTNLHSQWIPASPGEEHYAEIKVAASSGPVKVIVGVQYGDGNKSNVGVFWSPVKTTTSAEIIKREAIAPANTRYIRFIFGVQAGGYAPTGHIAFTGPILRRKNGSEMFIDASVLRSKIANGAVSEQAAYSVWGGYQMNQASSATDDYRFFDTEVFYYIGEGSDAESRVIFSPEFYGAPNYMAVNRPLVNGSRHANFTINFTFYKWTWSNGVLTNKTEIAQRSALLNRFSWQDQRLIVAYGADDSSSLVPDIVFNLGTHYNAGQAISMRLGYYSYSSNPTECSVTRNAPGFGFTWKAFWK